MKRITQFFFGPISATGFGLMRIAWSATVFFSMSTKVNDVIYYYSNAGLIPPALEPVLIRDQYNLSVFQWFNEPSMVFYLYILLLTLLLWSMLGLLPRLSVLGSAILLFSFHERMTMILGGGDTVLRLIGFILAISPGIEALSLRRLIQQVRYFKKHKTFLPPLTMPRWPMLLLLWQLMVIYLTSTWTKLLGSMWWKGTALSVILHHTTFSRFPGMFARFWSVLSPLFTLTILLYQASWIGFLIPRSLFERGLQLSRDTYRRSLIVAGFLFHMGILTFMEVGSFSLAMFAALLGLVQQSDIELLRSFINRWRGHTPERSIIVLYDEHCGLCTRVMALLLLFDPLHRLRAATYHNQGFRRRFAPGIPFKELDSTVHVRFANGKIVTGYDAFKRLIRYLPFLWPLYPFLLIPGSTTIGRFIYQEVSKRSRCKDGQCKI